MKFFISLIIFFSASFLCISQTTIITHGFTPAGAPKPTLDWMLVMAQKIQVRAGGSATIRLYNKTTGNFDLYSGYGAMNILLYDWHTESNDPESGFTEAAGSALFAALIKGEQQSDFTLTKLHFIGHSRGTVVNSEAVERLLVAGYAVDHVTYLDAHDWGVGITHIDFDANPNGSGVEGWTGIGWADSYWQDATFDLEGRAVAGTYSKYLGAVGHSMVHEWYEKSIEDPNIHDGYYYAELGGGMASRPPKSSATTNTFFNFANDGVVNGNFQRGSWVDFTAQPGWTQHGGAGDGHIDNGILELDYGNTYFIHDRLYIPSDASKLKFTYDITDIDAGAPFAVDQFLCRLGNGTVLLDKVWLNAYSSGTFSLDVTAFQNTVQTVELRIVDQYGGTVWLNSQMEIDNIIFELQPQSAVNNDCSNAALLTSNTSCNYASGTTVGATQSIAALTCNNYTGNADDDVWYKFTAVATSHTVSLQGSPTFDAVVDIRSGSCNGTNIGCSDNGGGAGGLEKVNLSGLTIGNTYFVRVYSYGGSSFVGTFQICVTHSGSLPPPANDDCSNAILMNSNVTCNYTSGTTVGATQSIAALTCNSFTGNADDDVWYKFTAVAASHTVSLQGSPTFDAVVDIRSGSCNGTNIGCSDNGGGAGGSEKVILSGLTISNTYFVRIYSYGGSLSTGTFDVCITHLETSPFPANNDCANAVLLTSDTTCNYTSGTTVGATQSIAALTCNSFTGNADDDVWYKFTAVAASHTVSLQGSPTFDAVVDIRSGSCNGTNIGCSDNGGGAGGSEKVILSGLIINNTYFVRIYSYGGSSSVGTYQVCVTHNSPPSAPGNDGCSNAIVLTSNTACNYISGTTVGATQSVAALTCNNYTGNADDDVWYKFTAVAASHTVSVQGASGFDPIVDVRSGSCNGANIDCADSTFSGGLEKVNLSGLTIGNTYYVRVYSYGGSSSAIGSFDICVTYSAPTNIESFGEKMFVNLFPNPTTGIFNLLLQGTNSGTFTFVLYDIAGRLVKQLVLAGNDSEPYSISIQELPTGFYSYEIVTENENIARGKIVKK